jgi:hypothetical protein
MRTYEFGAPPKRVETLDTVDVTHATNDREVYFQRE